jgi:hypothetical protein
MSAEEAVGPKSLDSNSAQQEPMSALYEGNKDGSPSSTLSNHKLIDLIWHEFSTVTEEYVLVYKDVDIKTAHAVIDELDRRKEGTALRYAI